MGSIINILPNATVNPTNGAVFVLNERKPPYTFQASLAGTGAITATVVVYVSNDNIQWLLRWTVNLSGTTTATDGFATSETWGYVKSSVTAFGGAGSGHIVNVTMGTP